MLLKKILAYFVIRIEEQTERQIYNLAFILFAFCVLFCQFIWVPGFFHDGNLYAALGRNAALFNQWLLPSLSELNYKNFLQHPPFYFMLEGLYFKIVPATWTFARLFGVSWAFGILCLLLLLIKKAHSYQWSFLTGTLFVIIPPLIKKSRFPNLDLPLAFFIFLGLFIYFIGRKKESEKISYPLVGLIFGLALLTKGPPAIVLPLTIFLHLILDGNIKELKKLTPWISLLFGVLIFTAWVIIVTKKSGISVYDAYLKSQLFGTIVEGRGKEDFSVFTYPYFLLTQLGPIFLFSLYGLYQVLIKDKKDSLALLFASLYLSVLIPFSLVRWKYSHYLMPIYPAIAALAAYPISKLSLKFHRFYSYIFKAIIIFIALALLCFPITNTTRRDKELFEVITLLDYFPKKPNSWMVVENCYPYHNVTNLVGWINPEANVYDLKNINISPLIDNPNKTWIILINEERAQQIQHILNPRFKKLIHFKEWHMLVYLDKNVMSDKESELFFIQNHSR